MRSAGRKFHRARIAGWCCVMMGDRFMLAWNGAMWRCKRCWCSGGGGGAVAVAAFGVSYHHYLLWQRDGAVGAVAAYGRI